MNRNQIVLYFFAFLLVVILTNGLIEVFVGVGKEQNVAKTSRQKNDSLKERAVSVPSKIRHPLIPEDPAKYGIISYTPDTQPRTQEQWNLFMEKALAKSKVLEQENAKPAIEKMKMTPGEFNTRMTEIDTRIEKFKKRKEENPSDEEAEVHLQSLYILKSLGQVLENKVTAP